MKKKIQWCQTWDQLLSKTKKKETLNWILRNLIFLSTTHYSVFNPFQIVHKSGPWHWHPLCKLSERFDNCNGCYGLQKFGEITV